MSIWYEIEEEIDIDISEDEESVEILFNSAEWGNEYVTIPISLVEKALNSRKISNRCSLCKGTGKALPTSNVDEYYKD